VEIVCSLHAGWAPGRNAGQAWAMMMQSAARSSLTPAAVTANVVAGVVVAGLTLTGAVAVFGTMATIWPRIPLSLAVVTVVALVAGVGANIAAVRTGNAGYWAATWLGYGAAALVAFLTGTMVVSGWIRLNGRGAFCVLAFATVTIVMINVAHRRRRRMMINTYRAIFEAKG
jgi:hypothetical protein